MVKRKLKTMKQLLMLGIFGCFITAVQANELAIVASDFGVHNQQKVSLFNLTNANGMTVKITNYGATVTAIILPDAKGNKSNIVAGFDHLSGYFSEEYINNSPYFGGIIGRYTSFIKNSTFTLDGTVYNVADNAKPHHIHGGKQGFDKRLWQVIKQQQNKDSVSLVLGLKSPDGEESYPGNVEVSVEYLLTNNNELKINYLGKTDKRTPLSLTNHTYFNLNGFKSDALDHNVQLLSKAYLTPDDVGMHDGKLTQVKGATDFNQLKPLRSAFKDLPQGFEHFYVFDNADKSLDKIAYVEEPTSGRSMEVYTTEPSTLFYTGRYTSDKLKREDGTQFGKFRAFCLETSKYPNGPNIKGSPRTILSPNEQYNETTVYKFSW